MNLLPPGLLGLIVVGMAAATMSSMDSFLNGASGVVVKNIYLPLLSALKKQAPEPLKLLKITRYVSLFFGLWGICTAFFLDRLSGAGGIFGIMMTAIALIGSPTAYPVILSLIVRKIPLWGFYLGMVTGFMASLTIFILQKDPDFFLTWYEKIFIMMGTTLIPTLASRPFWRYSPRSFRDLVDGFFEKVSTPIDVSGEVGETIDGQLLRNVGSYVIVSSLAVALLVFTAEKAAGLTAIIFISVFLFVLGLSMYLRGKKTLD